MGLPPAIEFPGCDLPMFGDLQSAQITLIEQRGELHLPKITEIMDEKYLLSHPCWRDACLNYIPDLLPSRQVKHAAALNAA